MAPLLPVLAVMVLVLKVKVAVTEALALMVTVQVGLVPLQLPPDQPPKTELASGVAVKVTAVPALKVEPEGLFETVPVPVPFLEIVKA